MALDNDGRKGQTDALAERRQERPDEWDFGVTLTATEYETMCAPRVARLLPYPVEGA
jgi:hypothetical protein